jgi:hypothetical protein
MRATLQYKLTLGFAAVGVLGWLSFAIQQWIAQRTYASAAVQSFRGQDADRGVQAMEIAAARQLEYWLAAATLIVFGVAAVALLRRTWNAWDWATAIVGGATVLSGLLLCGSSRVRLAVPLSLVPLWFLLYRPGVKQACGVGPPDEPATNEDENEGEMIDPQRERAKLAGLRQSLQLFEAERGISTDDFVERYVRGVEDETPDNEEWFALARMTRRAEERIARLNGHQPD